MASSIRATRNKGPRRHRYYVCYKAQQKGWKNCQTKSVGAESIEGAVLTSIRRLATDRELAEAVLAEAMTQLEGRTHELVAERTAAKRNLRQLNQDLAKLAGETGSDTGLRFERIRSLEEAIRATERRLEEIARELARLDQEPHDLTITACVDGKHMAGSLHYAGAATDIRTRDLPADKIPTILAKLKEALAGDFDVLLEGDHIHIEFQPKQSLTNA